MWRCILQLSLLPLLKSQHEEHPPGIIHLPGMIFTKLLLWQRSIVISVRSHISDGAQSHCSFSIWLEKGFWGLEGRGGGCRLIKRMIQYVLQLSFSQNVSKSSNFRNLDTLRKGDWHFNRGPLNRGLTVFLSPKWGGSRRRCHVWPRNIDRTCFEFCTLRDRRCSKGIAMQSPTLIGLPPCSFSLWFQWIEITAMWFALAGGVLCSLSRKHIIKVLKQHTIKIEKSLRNTASDCDQWGNAIMRNLLSNTTGKQNIP